MATSEKQWVQCEDRNLLWGYFTLNETCSVMLRRGGAKRSGKLDFISPRKDLRTDQTPFQLIYSCKFALGFPNAWYTNQHYAVSLETTYGNRTLCLDVVNNVTYNALIVHCFQTLFTICCYKQCNNNTLCPAIVDSFLTNNTVIVLCVGALLTKFSYKQCGNNTLCPATVNKISLQTMR